MNKRGGFIFNIIFLVIVIILFLIIFERSFFIDLFNRIFPHSNGFTQTVNSGLAHLGVGK